MKQCSSANTLHQLFFVETVQKYFTKFGTGQQSKPSNPGKKRKISPGFFQTSNISVNLCACCSLGFLLLADGSGAWCDHLLLQLICLSASKWLALGDTFLLTTAVMSVIYVLIVKPGT